MQRVPFREIIHPPPGITLRVGLLPYTVVDGETYYLFGSVSRKQGEGAYLTDVGGGCKRGETPYQCLLREIDEEVDDVTASVIKNLLHNKRWEKEVWRESGPTFQSLGYPWQMGRRKGPIHRFYIFLDVDDPEMLLGGPTGKEEAKEYTWYSSKDLRKVKTEDINSSLVGFYRHDGILQAT